MSEDDEYLRALEVQRKNFEAQFGSLETMGFEDKSKGNANILSDEENQDEAQDEYEFKGFVSNDESGSDLDNDMDSSEESVSEEEETRAAPKVVKINDHNHTTNGPVISKADKKLLRSGRAPTLAEIARKEQELEKKNKKSKQAVQEDEDNLENDLKLQRLLQESHILANKVEYSGADVTLQTLDFEAPTGNARKRTLDSRLRSISSINSSTKGLPKTLEKMPMSMRKGMIASRERQIAKYEEEARNAGIILSKVKKGELRDIKQGKGSTLASDRLGTGKKAPKRIRDRGLKINSVGRSTRNGIIISQQEIDKVNNQGRRFNKKKR
ncbi:uncharacterized protein AC631_00635 [Debaryomyces fabryi]|uniref:Protein FAF1 n=1 Tax=Debaryomyces fabryi TaxID=58627 RepID=A0A0V1Q5E6_9ASCO|nr:uncharacterized protein AC631_00635 [Debaryomyces fabryi]KSA03660.1 hypothetical protein AC631_00635 [Debaryomyces fabryi]CUM52609.1 unnamed protein product [Debaryomyces fabryi]